MLRWAQRTQDRCQATTILIRRRRVVGRRRPPRTMRAPTTGHHRTARRGMTHVDYQAALHPPPSDLVEFQPPPATDQPPPPHPRSAPEPCEERVLHEGAAPVTKRIGDLGTKTHQMSYRTVLGGSIRCVSEFRSGRPKRQPIPLEGTTNPRSARSTRKNGHCDKADPCSTHKNLSGALLHAPGGLEIVGF